ncbi:hypothetical protein MMC25_000434 [Agyrium rufum]|nr:hypothetical protein [Agyrium rufum]
MSARPQRDDIAYGRLTAQDTEDSHPLRTSFDSAVSNDTDLEVRDDDEDILDEEEERDRLLSRPTKPSILRNLFGRDEATDANSPQVARETRREKRRERRKERRARRRERRARDDGPAEILYEMEEGGEQDDNSSASSQISFSQFDEKAHIDPKGRRRRRALYFVAFPFLFCVLVGLLYYGSYNASKNKKADSTWPRILSNGSSTFKPTTILISLDGFRADFLNRGLTPSLNSFIAEGVSPEFMRPSFPSLTFPNHYTMVTGLHPESHGVVGNTFWDPALQSEFYYTDPARSMQPQWWDEAEPLWVTAESQGIRSAIHMWPGSEAHLQSLTTLEEVPPAFVDVYNGTETLSRKVDRILSFLDLQSYEEQPIKYETMKARPQLIVAYVPNVDAHGHLYGPNSTQIRQTIKNVDIMLGSLFAGIAERNLASIVNIVIVSDHGMATTATSRLLQYEDLIEDTSLIEHIDGWPLYGLRPKYPEDLQSIYDMLVAKAEKTAGYDVYLRDVNMPERYHFTNNPRIAPLWLVPKTGWAIVHKDEFNIADSKRTGAVYHPRGLHGYDHEDPLMRAIFIARGPAFPHDAGSRLEAFQNTDVYNIVCDSLGMEPRPNNGTLRLPLKPIGVHKIIPPTTPDYDLPADDTPTNPSTVPSDDPHASFVDDPNARPTILPVDPAQGGEEGAPEANAGKDSDQETGDEEEEEGGSWWDVVTGKIDDAKTWFDEWLDSLHHKDGKGDKEA